VLIRVWHDMYIYTRFICEILYIHIYHSYVWRDSFTRVPGVHTCDVIWIHTQNSYVWHDSFTFVPCVQTCHAIYNTYVYATAAPCVSPTRNQPHSSIYDTTRSYAWHDSFTCVPWLGREACEPRLTHMCDTTPDNTYSNERIINAQFQYVTWLIHKSAMTRSWDMCAMTHLYVWHNTWQHLQRQAHHQRPIIMCDMTHSHMCHDSVVRHVSHDSPIWVTQHLTTLILTSASSTSNYNVWHDSFISVQWLVREACVPWLIHMCDITPDNTYSDERIINTKL